jgi:hypothetical protein
MHPSKSWLSSKYEESMKSVSFIHIDLIRTCTINFLPFAFGDIELEMEDMVPGSIEHGL